MRSLIRRIGFNAFWLSLDRVMTGGAAFLLSIILARYLGVDGFGTYAFALSLVGLFAPLAGFGLEVAVVQEVVLRKESEGAIIPNALWLALSVAAMTCVILALAVMPVSDSPMVRMLVWILSVRLLWNSFATLSCWFQAHLLSNYVVWAKSIALAAAVAVLLAVVWAGGGLIAVAWVSVLETALVACALVAIFLLKGPRSPTWRPNLRLWAELAQRAWPLAISGLAVAVYMKIDQVMLGYMRTPAEVGLYAAAARLSEAAYFIPMAVGASAFPAILRMRERLGGKVAAGKMQGFYDVMAAIGYMVAIPVTILAGPMLRLVFGVGYGPAAPILQVHVWAFVFVCLGVARNRWLFAEDMRIVAMSTAAIGAVLNVLLNLWLIPLYGGVGAAWATLISYAVAGYGACLAWPHLWGLFRQLTLSLFIPIRLPSYLRSGYATLYQKH